MADFRVNKELEKYANSILAYFSDELLSYDNYEDFVTELDYAIMDDDVIDIPEIDREDSFKLAQNMAEYEGSDIDDSMDGDWDSGMASAGWGTDEDYGLFDGVIKDTNEIIHLLDESNASRKAKKLGLIHVGFGNYAAEQGASAKYKTVNGKLSKVGGTKPKKQKVRATPTTTAKKTEEPKKKKAQSGIQDLRRVSGEKFTYEYEKDGRKYKFTLNKRERKELAGKTSLMSIVIARQKKREEKEKSKQFKKGMKLSPKKK